MYTGLVLTFDMRQKVKKAFKIQKKTKIYSFKHISIHK